MVFNTIKGLRDAEEGSGEAGARLEARTLSTRRDFCPASALNASSVAAGSRCRAAA